MQGLWDAPFVSEIAFHPRKISMNISTNGKARDGMIKVDEEISIGYRFFISSNSLAPIIIKFSGNAEIAGDMDNYFNVYEPHASLFCVDYRGFGWSHGSPSLTKLCPDAEIVFQSLPEIFKSYSIPSSTPLILYGRSIGGCSAIHLCQKYQYHNINGLGKISTLILESCFANVKELPMVNEIVKMMPHIGSMMSLLPDPFNNLEKISTIKLPTLIIHGDLDDISPVKMGKDLYKKSESQKKKLLIYKGSGHNDVIFNQGERYFLDFFTFVDIHSSCQISEMLCINQKRKKEAIELINKMLEKYAKVDESDLVCLLIERAAVFESLKMYAEAKLDINKGLLKATRDEVLNLLLLKWRVSKGSKEAEEDINQNKKRYINSLKDEMIINDEAQLESFAILSFQITLIR